VAGILAGFTVGDSVRTRARFAIDEAGVGLACIGARAFEHAHGLKPAGDSETQGENEPGRGGESTQAQRSRQAR
jgi:hypothetical protein